MRASLSGRTENTGPENGLNDRKKDRERGADHAKVFLDFRPDADIGEVICWVLDREMICVVCPKDTGSGCAETRVSLLEQYPVSWCGYYSQQADKKDRTDGYLLPGGKIKLPNSSNRQSEDASIKENVEYVGDKHQLT